MRTTQPKPNPNPQVSFALLGSMSLGEGIDTWLACNTIRV